MEKKNETRFYPKLRRKKRRPISALTIMRFIRRTAKNPLFVEDCERFFAELEKGRHD